MEIDWSKAPEGATGAMVANFDSRDEGGSTWIGKVEFIPCGSEDRELYTEGPQAWTYYERPVAWIGEGLPPVGTVCAVLNSDLGSPTWERCTILYSGKHRVIYDSESCEERVAFIEDLKFRPARTPEQIEAEEREKAVQHMVGFIRERRMTVSTPENPKQEATLAAEALYDAGYRKFEIVDGEA